MTEPTEEQIKEFWEWCGQKRENRSEYGRLPDWGYPPIDLNNLFKWAVPKLYECSLSLSGMQPNELYWCAEVSLRENDLTTEEYNKDPALALFWAIYKVIKEVEK